MSRPGVYISYAAADRDAAEALARELAAQGVQPSLDVLDDDRRAEREAFGEDDVLPDDASLQLENADLVAVVATPAVESDRWAVVERTFAADLDIPVVAVGSHEVDGLPLVPSATDLPLERGEGLPSAPAVTVTPGPWRFRGSSSARDVELQVELDGDGGLAGELSEGSSRKDVTGRWEQGDDGVLVLEVSHRLGLRTTTERFRIRPLTATNGIDAYALGPRALTWELEADAAPTSLV